MQKSSRIDNSIYDSLGERWYTAFDDPVALLRAESRTKAPWVLEKMRGHFRERSDVRLLDIGCGAGFLTNEMAGHGFHVTGLDQSLQSLEVAKRYDATKSVDYVTGDAYSLPFADQSFDAVSAMDFLEHIDDPLRAIREMSRVLKPGGLFFFHTFNRNRLAQLVIIQLVEKLVKNTPKHMHVIELFITPEELVQMSHQAGLQVREMTGIRPRFSTLTLRSLFTGVVPEKFAFKLTRSLKLSYMGYAEKPLEQKK
ncbi:MAG: 3-demethylubiquinone-9 3-O-methyltransferase [Bdellovibrionales bacterium]|nr:3-demethylubiquinone-9 3-O-methyltransferase [Bdellovibrionales bacterium]